METTRVEAFSDGVFAIAITLLVLTIGVPSVGPGHLGRALLHQWPTYAAYLVSFLTIGIIWVNHHGMFARIERVDRPLLFFNLLLLMTVSFIPFPTALVSRYLESGQDARVATAVYAGTMTLLGIAFSAVWMWAILHRLLIPELVDHARIRATIPRYGTGMGAYALAIVLALFSPIASLVLCGIMAVFYVFDQQSVRAPPAEDSGQVTA